MASHEVITPTQGLVGWLHGLDCSETDTVLVFQLPRRTEHLNAGFVEAAKKSIAEIMPPGKRAIVIGCDINIIELTGADISALKLKGIL